MIELDLDFSEERDAEFIKSCYGEWDEIKKQLLGIIRNLEHKKEGCSNNSKGYFG